MTVRALSRETTSSGPGANIIVNPDVFAAHKPVIVDSGLSGAGVSTGGPNGTTCEFYRDYYDPATRTCDGEDAEEVTTFDDMISATGTAASESPTL